MGGSACGGPVLHCHVVESCDHKMDSRGCLAFTLMKHTCLLKLPCPEYVRTLQKLLFL